MSEAEIGDSTLDSIRHGCCCGKESYHSQDAAEDRMERLQRKYPNDTHPSHVYSCVFCNHYHIGRTSKEGRSSAAMKNSLRILEDTGRMLRYDFESPCPICANKPT